MKILLYYGSGKGLKSVNPEFIGNKTSTADLPGSSGKEFCCQYWK